MWHGVDEIASQDINETARVPSQEGGLKKLQRRPIDTFDDLSFEQDDCYGLGVIESGHTSDTYCLVLSKGFFFFSFRLVILPFPSLVLDFFRN